MLVSSHEDNKIKLNSGDIEVVNTSDVRYQNFYVDIILIQYFKKYWHFNIFQYLPRLGG